MPKKGEKALRIRHVGQCTSINSAQCPRPSPRIIFVIFFQQRSLHNMQFSFGCRKNKPKQRNRLHYACVSRSVNGFASVRVSVCTYI